MGPVGTQPPQQSPLSAHAYCGQTLAHLSNCWALVLNVNIFLRSVRDFCKQKLSMKFVSVLVIILQYSKKSTITMDNKGFVARFLGLQTSTRLRFPYSRPYRTQRRKTNDAPYRTCDSYHLRSPNRNENVDETVASEGVYDGRDRRVIRHYGEHISVE